MRHLTLLGLLCAWTPSALADFDPQLGKVELEGTIQLDFESGSDPGLPITIFDTQFQPAPEQVLAEAYVDDEAQMIEGRRGIRIGGESLFVGIDLRGVQAQLQGRRTELRFWQRPEGTRANAVVSWYATGVEEILRGDFRSSFLFGQLNLQPTGRVTDDGWEEWTTGPFDFALAGDVGPQLLYLLDAQLTAVQQGAAAYDPTLNVLVDAIEILDHGPASVPAVSCNLADQTVSCGEAGACMYGRCVDGALALGGRVFDPQLRAEYLQRKTFEYTQFEGGRVPISRGQALAERLEQLQDATPYQFRAGLSAAIESLADGHAGPPQTSQRFPLQGGICIYQSEADLLDGGVRPMVFESAQNSLGDQLQTGDVLELIDGLEVDAWAQLAAPYLNYAGDPRARSVIITPQLLSAAIQTGAVLSFVRCEDPTCAQPVRFDVDLAQAIASIWSGVLPDWAFDVVSCDFRFRRALEPANVRAYSYAGFTDDPEGVRTLLINGVPSPFGRGASWFSTVEAALRDGPPKLIFDQRLGQGGSIEAVDLFAGFLLGEDEFSRMEMIPQLHGELTDPLRDSLAQCSRSQTDFLDNCGVYFEWRLAQFHPARGAAQTSSVAVLQGLDVSGNDYTSRLLQFRSAATRFFGPAPTYGAFGVVWVLPAYLGDTSGGSFQVHDTLFLATPEDRNLDFQTSFGIEPDEVVYQKQSDALAGIDTVVEAARAWLRGTP